MRLQVFFTIVQLRNKHWVAVLKKHLPTRQIKIAKYHTPFTSYQVHFAIRWSRQSVLLMNCELTWSLNETPTAECMFFQARLCKVWSGQTEQIKRQYIQEILAAAEKGSMAPLHAFITGRVKANIVRSYRISLWDVEFKWITSSLSFHYPFDLVSEGQNMGRFQDFRMTRTWKPGSNFNQ